MPTFTVDLARPQRDLTDEDIQYVNAVLAALRAGQLPRGVRQDCTECGSSDPSDEDHVRADVPGIGPILLIGCEGYHVIDPNTVGLDRPTWQPVAAQDEVYLAALCDVCLNNKAPGRRPLPGKAEWIPIVRHPDGWKHVEEPNRRLAHIPAPAAGTVAPGSTWDCDEAARYQLATITEPATDPNKENNPS